WAATSPWRASRARARRSLCACRATLLRRQRLPRPRHNKAGVRSRMPESDNGTLWEYLAGSPRSFRLDARKLHHLGPLLNFFNDQFSVLGRRATKRRVAQIGKPRLDYEIGEARIDLAVELVDNFSRCAFGRTNASNSACFVARHEFADGWEVWQCFGAHRSAHGERAQFG